MSQIKIMLSMKRLLWGEHKDFIEVEANSFHGAYHITFVIFHEVIRLIDPRIKKPSHKVHSLREVDPQAQQKGCYNTVLLQAAQIYGVQWATFKEILNSCLHLMLNP